MATDRNPTELPKNTDETAEKTPKNTPKHLPPNGLNNQGRSAYFEPSLPPEIFWKPPKKRHQSGKVGST